MVHFSWTLSVPNISVEMPDFRLAHTLQDTNIRSEYTHPGYFVPIYYELKKELSIDNVRHLYKLYI